MKGCENEDSLRGSGLSGLVLDEAAFIDDLENKWNFALQPSLADKQGWCIFASTPCGHNYFHDLYNKYAHYNYPSGSNEYLEKEEIDRMREDMSELQFKQEILAEFIPQGSYQYFQEVDGIINNGISLRPEAGHNYLIGCDIGRHHDSTVLIAISQQTNEIHGFESFDDIDWPLQKYRIANFVRKYNNGVLIIDATNNSSIGEDLMTEGISVEQFIFTPKSKLEIYEKLRIYISQKEVFMPLIEKLVFELSKFEFRLEDRLKLGTQSSVYHDDCVASFALAVKNLNKLSVVADTERMLAS